jgi:exo-beta-1,3-glucanase (GH17 family)
VTTFVFEAFDENWKGGADPADVEKHWGLFHADRTPKAALGGYSK